MAEVFLPNRTSGLPRVAGTPSHFIDFSRFRGIPLISGEEVTKQPADPT
jgi:hypothetical protein